MRVVYISVKFHLASHLLYELLRAVRSSTARGRGEWGGVGCVYRMKSDTGKTHNKERRLFSVDSFVELPTVRVCVVWQIFDSIKTNTMRC